MEHDEFMKKPKDAVDTGVLKPSEPVTKPKIIFAEEARAIRAQTQCVNKSAYPTEERAQKYAQASADRAQKEMTIYECDLCGKWHMSSKFIPPKYLNGRPPAQQIVFPRKPK